jgi:hypothetical protein
MTRIIINCEDITYHKGENKDDNGEAHPLMVHFNYSSGFVRSRVVRLWPPSLNICINWSPEHSRRWI